MNIVLRSLFATLIAFGCLGSNRVIAKTITIDASATASRDLAQLIHESISGLSVVSDESHRLILKGEFAPTSTVEIQWWGEEALSIVGPAILEGSKLSNDSATVFLAGRNLTVQNLRFVNSQGHALIVGGNSDHYAVDGCVFEGCRKSAIHVWNDPHSITRERGPRGKISNNRIRSFNLEKAKWANDGITVFDQRVTISGNVISDSATETNGIRAMGQSLLIEDNVVRDVSTMDAGGIYLWGGPHASLFRGNVVRRNWVVGASRGIYLDDGTSGVRVEENVVQDSSVCAIFISGGRDNLIQRNVVDQTPVFVHLDSRCLGWDSRPEYAAIADESFSRLRNALSDKAKAKRLRSEYPGIRSLDFESLEPHLYGRPEGNIVRDNFAREVAVVWELMDFSEKVRTPFQKLNRLSLPTAFAKDEDLGQISLRKRFGFAKWDRLERAP